MEPLSNLKDQLNLYGARSIRVEVVHGHFILQVIIINKNRYVLGYNNDCPLCVSTYKRVHCSAGVHRRNQR